MHYRNNIGLYFKNDASRIPIMVDNELIQVLKELKNSYWFIMLLLWINQLWIFSQRSTLS